MRKPTADEKKQTVENYQKMFKRANFNGYLYLDILKKELNEYIECKNKSDKLYRSIDSKEWISEYYELQNKMKNKEVIVITFSAMFLECLIWDYARTNGLSKNKLNKMGALKKWKEVPILVNSKLSIDSGAISLLEKLIDERNNKIVHSKSEPLSDNYEQLMDYIDTLSQGRSITANEAYQCVIDCTEGLKKVDTTDYWFFQGNAWDSYMNA